MPAVISPEKFLGTMLALSEELGDDVYRQGLRRNYLIQRRFEAGVGFPENHFLLNVTRRSNGHEGVRIAAHAGTDKRLSRLPHQVLLDLEDVDAAETARLGVTESKCKEITLDTGSRLLTVLDQVRFSVGKKIVAAYHARGGEPVYNATEYIPHQENGYLTVVTNKVITETDGDVSTATMNELDQLAEDRIGNTSLASLAMADMINVVSIVTGRYDIFND
jgi:hypothetical protein